MTKFKQQALPAWQPILTAGTVLPTFFLLGVAFVPIGVGLMYFSDTVKEVSIEYTDCNVDRDANKMCKDVITNFKVETQWRTCALKNRGPTLLYFKYSVKKRDFFPTMKAFTQS